MTACPDRMMALHALMDDELDALSAAALEEHLRGCSGCRAALDELLAVRAALSDPRISFKAPDALRRRIAAQVGGPTNVVAMPQRPWRAFAGGGAVGAMAASLALFLALPQLAEPGMTGALVDGHIRALESGHLIDVRQSNRHVVKPWFNGRVDFAPPVADLQAQGFPLVGGRLDALDGQRVAVLVYRRRLHSINVFVRPKPALASPWGNSSRDAGYNLMRWTDGGLEFWAVSDLAADELTQFRDAFRAVT